MSDRSQSPEGAQETHVIAVSWPGTETYLQSCRESEHQLLVKLPVCYTSYGGNKNFVQIGDRRIPCRTYRCKETKDGLRCPASIKLLKPRDGDIAYINATRIPAFAVWESNEKHDGDHSNHYISPAEALTYPSPAAFVGS